MAKIHDSPAGQAQKIVVVGGGRAGTAILTRLAADPCFAPFVVDVDYGRVSALRAAGIPGDEASGSDATALVPILRDAACVVCAAPASVAPVVARAAIEAGCHYVDLCEGSPITPDSFGQGLKPGQCLAPGCGLAPGLVPALVDGMIRSGTRDADITAYVGVLPALKTNRLGYGNLWGLDGLMDEYTRPCLSLEAGEIVSRPPLRDVETVQIDGTAYEAFSTSGSLDDLVQRSAGQLAGLRFKTLRYPGHLDYILFLLDDLRLGDRLYMFRNLLMNGLAKIERDRVLIHIVDHNPEAPRHLTRIFDAVEGGGHLVTSAVSEVSAAHVCAVVDILVRGLAPSGGVLHHEHLRLDLLRKSRHCAALLGAAPALGETVGRTLHGRKGDATCHAKD